VCVCVRGGGGCVAVQHVRSRPLGPLVQFLIIPYNPIQINVMMMRILHPVYIPFLIHKSTPPPTLSTISQKYQKDEVLITN